MSMLVFLVVGHALSAAPFTVDPTDLVARLDLLSTARTLAGVLGRHHVDSSIR
jgi:hypothetical protein